MPWSTPTLKDVRKLTRDFVMSAMGARVLIPNSLLRIMADAQAGLTHLTLLYVDWLSKQLLPDTAETEWLDRHGNIWLKNSDGSTGRKAASFASGTATMTGTGGIIVPVGSVLYGINGQTYETTEEIAIGDGATPVAVMAQTAGAASNLPEGDTLTLQTPIGGVDGQVTVVEITGGADVENDDDLRERILQRIQNPPMGGSEQDYVRWALAVPGVTRAWAFANGMGIGTVSVFFVMDDLRSDNYGIPTEDDLEIVRAYIDTVRPVAVKDIFVYPPVPEPYDLTITGLSRDDESTRARIELSLRAMDRKRSKPGQTMYRAWVDEAISNAVGEDHHELVFTTQTMPNNAAMPVLGTITYAT